MTDYISAKCFACGAVIRAPSTYGGRQAKCPKCQAIMTIPRPADTAELIADDQLQEVATGMEVADEDEAPIPPQPPGETAPDEPYVPVPEPEPAAPPAKTGTRKRTGSGTMRRSRGARGRGGRAGGPRGPGSAGGSSR